MIEISGQEKKIEAFIDLMRPFGILELVRTGRIAMVRGIDRTSHAGSGLRKFADRRSGIRSHDEHWTKLAQVGGRRF